jgi:SAM-dependent methyltransferase
VELGQHLHGITIIPGSLADLPRGLGTFDCVILGAVLEHLLDLSGALRDMRSLLVPEGLLYVNVPDAEGFACAGHAPPYQEFSVEHINYFSTRSLANLLQINGFREVFSRRSTLEQAPGIMVHEIKAAFRPAEASRVSPLRDSATEESLRAYIAASAAADRALQAVISRLVTARTPIVVWGVGTLTQRLLALGGLDRAVIRAFVDSNPRYQGLTVGGIPVIAPEALRGRSEPILVSTLVHEAEIIRQIRADLGLGNEVITFSAPEAGAVG